MVGSCFSTQINVVEAGDGEECINILKKQSFDIIFLDYMMPNMDGVETLHAIKNAGICLNTPVVMLTANALKGAKEEFLKEGFTDYLTKPIIPEKLDNMIMKYLPKDKVVERNTQNSDVQISVLPELDEFDFDIARKLLNSEEMVLEVLRDFGASLEGLPKKLNSFYDGMWSGEGGSTSIDKEKLSLYRIEVHALKSTAGTVGALLLSKLARLLEVAATEEDVTKLAALHPILLDEIDKHKKRIKVAMPNEEKAQNLGDVQMLITYLDTLYQHLEDCDYNMADAVCEEIGKYTYSDEITEFVKKILECVLNLDDDEAMVTIRELKSIIIEG